MFETSSLEEKVQDLIVDLCKTLYDHGYREVPVGAIMRLIGVENEVATEHDMEYFRLDEDFEAMIEEEYEAMEPPPPGTTIH